MIKKRINNLSNKNNSFLVNGNLALKNNEPIIKIVDKKENFDTPKILSIKMKRVNKIYMLCWQLGGDSDC